MTQTHQPVDYAPRIPTRSIARRTAEQQLRTVLLANATLSAAAGVAGLMAADWLTESMGLGDPTVMQVVSAALLVFATAVGWAAAKADRLASHALAISICDIAWVVATVVVAMVADLTTFGLVVAAISAVGVADFAIAQLWLRRKLAA